MIDFSVSIELTLADGTAARFMDVVGHIQAADILGRHEFGTGEHDWARELRWLLGAGCAGYIGIEAVPLGQSLALHGKAQALLPEARSTLADLPPGADLCGDQPHQASSFGGGRNDGGGRPGAGYMEQFTASIANYGVTHWNGSTANSNPNQAGDIHGDTAQSGEC